MGRFRDAWTSLRGHTVQRSSSGFQSLLGDSTATGLSITPESSLRVSTVYACVRLIAESIGSLPVDVVRRRAHRRVVVDSALARLITHKPNSEQDAGEMWRTIIGWMLLEGNAYLYVERDPSGVSALWPLPASQIAPGRTGAGRLYYDLHIDPLQKPHEVPANVRLGPDRVLHFRAFGTSLLGLSPIRQIRESVATSVAAQQYMSRFYANDASPGGTISVPGALTDDQFARLNEQWKASHQGLSRSHLMAVLEGGAKWESIGLNPDDSAFIETQKWQTAEIARAFGVPPHMIGDTERSTSWGSGIEQQSIGYVQYTLTPWITRLERVLETHLLDAIDDDLRVRFRVDGLQRGDTASRYAAYATARQWGWLSANDVRELEDLNPVRNGDIYLQPLNMVPLASGSDGRSSHTGRSRQARRRIANSYKQKIADADRAVAELERRVVAGVASEHLRSPQAFLDNLPRAYEEDVQPQARAQFGPVYAALAAEISAAAADEIAGSPSSLEKFIAAYTAGHVAYAAGRSIAELRGALESDRLTDETAIAEMTRHWVDERPGVTARRESVELSGAATRATFSDNGIRQLRWISSGDACPYCSHINGEIVGMEESFMTKGAHISDGAGNYMSTSTDIHHPPIHDGCECEIAPA